ncbi:MAG: ribonuclease H-like domain-containing protein [Bacillota bacterium]|nr:ribonuclease H-like domain-containing protein [Bacillota bacterium]
MEHIIEKWVEETSSNPLWEFYFGDMKVGVLDIETTGLSPRYNQFILGGLYDVSRGEIHQVLAQSRDEEGEALRSFMDLVGDFDVLVTYNGKSFDMPFLRDRCEKLGVSYSGLKPYHLDLYIILRSYSDLRSFLPNFKQKTVENFMGLWNTRSDEISGRESVELYNHYELTRDLIARDKILLHNNDDVRQLFRLIASVNKCDINRGMRNYGFPIKVGEQFFVVEDSRIDRETLVYSGRCSVDFAYSCYEVGSEVAEIRCQDGRFKFRLPLICKQGLSVLDLDGLSMDSEPFRVYPIYSDGFVAVSDSKDENDRVINHFAREFIRTLCELILGEKIW